MVEPHGTSRQRGIRGGRGLEGLRKDEGFATFFLFARMKRKAASLPPVCVLAALLKGEVVPSSTAVRSPFPRGEGFGVRRKNRGIAPLIIPFGHHASVRAGSQ